MNPIVLIGAGVAAFLIYRAKVSVATIKGFVTKLQLSAQGITPVLTIFFDMINPSDVDVTIRGYSGELYLLREGKPELKIGDIIDTNTFTIKALNTTNVPIIGRLDPNVLWELLPIGDPEMRQGLPAGGTAVSLPPPPPDLLLVGSKGGKPNYAGAVEPRMSEEVINPRTQQGVVIQEPNTARQVGTSEAFKLQMANAAMFLQGLTIRYVVNVNTNYGIFKFDGKQQVV